MPKPKADEPSTAGIDGVTPVLDEKDLAAEYGWSMAVLNSDPDLKRIFHDAVQNTWTPQRFVAELRDTDWYRQRTEQQRSNAILKTTDPTEYKRRYRVVVGNARALMGSLGVPLSDAQVSKISADAFNLGWSEDELRRNIVNTADWKNIIKAPDTNGQAAELEQDIKKTAGAYGVNVSKGFIAKQVDRVLMQQGTRDGYVEYFRNAAKQTYAAYADQIDAGFTVDEIAEPYKQTVAKLLELNPEQVTLDEPLVKKWLTARDDKSKPAFVPMWKAENEARADARWLKTDNAREAASGAALKVLDDWGFRG